jgi:hypothetical protein
MKKFIRILCIMLIASLPVLAQEELGSEVDTLPPGFGGDIPVDGGLSLLLAAGAAFGGRRLYRQGAKKNQRA